MISDAHGLSSTQEALKTLTQMGLVDTQTVGRAGVYVINEQHASVAPLRALVDPITALESAIGEVIDARVKAVILLGSVARGEATSSNDIDLAVIAASTWDDRIRLQDTVQQQLGNHCDVLVFAQAEFNRLAAAGEPVVVDIVREGVALVGSLLRAKRGAA